MKKIDILNRIMHDYPQYTYITSDDDLNSAYLMLDIIEMAKITYDAPQNYNLYTLLHEIGHLQTNKLSDEAVDKEYKATQWAIRKLKKYRITLTQHEKEYIQDYIWRFDKKRGKYNRHILNWEV